MFTVVTWKFFKIVSYFTNFKQKIQEENSKSNKTQEENESMDKLKKEEYLIQIKKRYDLFVDIFSSNPLVTHW